MGTAAALSQLWEVTQRRPHRCERGPFQRTCLRRYSCRRQELTPVSRCVTVTGTCDLGSDGSPLDVGCRAPSSPASPHGTALRTFRNAPSDDKAVTGEARPQPSELRPLAPGRRGRGSAPFSCRCFPRLRRRGRRGRFSAPAFCRDLSDHGCAGGRTADCGCDPAPCSERAGEAAASPGAGSMDDAGHGPGVSRGTGARQRWRHTGRPAPAEISLETPRARRARAQHRPRPAGHPCCPPLWPPRARPPRVPPARASAPVSSLR